MKIPLNRFKLIFVKSQGPGGQNVNKTNSKAQLCVQLSNDWLPDSLLESIKQRNKNKINVKDELIIKSDEFRSQYQNEQACHIKFEQIFKEAENACKPESLPSKDQQEKYNPIMVAMEMLQKSNSAHDFSKFELLQRNLENSMNIIIEKYYSGFNNAVSVFGGIVEKVNDSKSEISKMKNELEAFRDQIQYKRADLPELYSKIGVFKESVQANQKATELSENRIKYTELSIEKFFIPATKLLNESFEVLKTYKIDSLDTYKLVLQEDKKHLTASIMDELLNHIFLKKSKATSQWYSKTIQDIPNFQDRIGKVPDDLGASFVEISSTSEKDLVMAPAEFDFKPDSNSIIYVSSLLQALNSLGTLQESLENVEQRISSELFLIVEDEIKKSSEKLKNSHATRNEIDETFVLVPTGMNIVSRDEFFLFSPILREMIGSIMSKFVVIVNIFKFVNESVKSFILFPDGQSPLDLSIQAAFREIRNFAASIIYNNSGNTTSSSGSTEAFSNPLGDIAEILKKTNLRSTADKNDLFTFSFNASEENISEIKSMPIKIKEKDREAAKRISAALNIDPYATSKKDTGHKKIVKPNIQYLQVLYNPIVIFNEILKEIRSDEPSIVESNETILKYFENAIEKEYIPFIETYMIHELVSAFKGRDSSNWVDFSMLSASEAGVAVPSFDSLIGKRSNSILCSYLTFVKLMCEACKLIYFIPTHQESFENIMEQLCDQLLDKSEVKLRDLLLVKHSREEDSGSNLLCFSVQFAKNPEIRSILLQNTLLSTDGANVNLNRLLSEKEALLMERLKGDRSIGKSELLFDPKVIREIALLQRSFEQVKGLIFMGKYSFKPGMTKIVVDSEENLNLHVYESGKKTIFKFGASFDAKFTIFTELLEKLAQTCLFTLHCEVRTHSFYFLDLAFREGSYKIEKIGSHEPDPYVLNWTSDLLNLSNTLADWFPLSKYLFLFDGLSITIDSVLVNNFQYIKSINLDGCSKLSTNTTVIIQVLTQVLPPTEVSLPKSTEYYRLSRVSTENLITEIQASGDKFTFSQYRALLDLAHREGLQAENNEAARKSYMDHLTLLKYIAEPKSSQK